MARRQTPEINAGSMADIAFLLLIFFLVTTTMDVDSGISRKLPEKTPPNIKPPILKMKNVLEIAVNRNNQILVEGKDYVEIDEIKQIAIDFIDNGGGVGKKVDGVAGKPCDWCNGKKDPKSSDHPNKAIIALENDRSTEYGVYVSIQNELIAAYSELRSRLSTKLYGKTYKELLKLAESDSSESLKAKIDNIKKKYPEIISEKEKQ